MRYINIIVLTYPCIILNLLFPYYYYKYKMVTDIVFERTRCPFFGSSELVTNTICAAPPPAPRKPREMCHGIFTFAVGSIPTIFLS